MSGQKFSCNGRRFVRRSTIVCAMALLVFSPPALSQMAVAEAGPSLFQSIKTQINTLLARAQAQQEYIQQNTRWVRTLQHYQQELIKVEGMVTSFNLNPNEPMQVIAEDRFVTARCGVGGSGLQGLLQSFSLDPNGNVVEQQRKICSIIQITENRKYNATVRFMREIAPSIQRDLDFLRATRGQSNGKGHVDGVSYNASAFSNQFHATTQNYQNQMNLYDEQIKTMVSAQRTLADIALRGSKSSGPLGTLVKTAALQGALKAGD